MQNTITVFIVAAVAAAGLADPRPERDGAAQQSSTSTSASAVRFGRVRLKTGVELHVAETGPANGEPILFLHGFTDSWFSYSSVLDALGPGFRAIAPSQRGHGDSERPPCCYRVPDFAEDAVALLDALGIGRATIVGHSMGSFIAQRIAIDHPDRVTRLVLIGSATTVATKPVVEFNEAVKGLKDPIDSGFAREFQASTVAKPLPPGFLDRVVNESMKVPARVWRDALAGLLASDSKAGLHRITAPTLIVWGEEDPLFRRDEQEALLRGITGARLIDYPGISHSPHWEDPARFVADLQDFLNEPTARAGATHHPHDEAAPGPRKLGTMPLLSGLGDWQHRISTRSAEAQRYFDQGLRLTYAFNHDEATRSFERAADIDSSCAMCYWGIAYAVGPNINLPMDSSVEPRALAATRRAASLASLTTAPERALIAAMSVRYGESKPGARAARDSAYASAMREVARRFPSDVDAQVLFADAMLNLRPWMQWRRDGRPHPGTEEVVATLERALRRSSDHPGACHFYVHAVEASHAPERALACAERLPRLMPAAGHVVHMPAHVYLRIGRYEDAARANIAAVEADGRYFAGVDVTPGMYPMFYAPHNLHFLWATYLLSGQRAKALGTARALTARVPVAEARTTAALEGFLTAPVLTLARFRDWNQLLAEPAPPAELRYVTGIWHFARGLAHAGRGDLMAAHVELDSVRAMAARAPNDLIIILNPAPALLALAIEVLAGEIAVRRQQYDQAIQHLRTAVRLEDALTYDEPPPWYHSARNVLGEALLEAGRASHAESAFREDLQFVRENGWSLSGLERALRAQGKTQEAARVARRLAAAWVHADVPPRIETQ